MSLWHTALRKLTISSLGYLCDNIGRACFSSGPPPLLEFVHFILLPLHNLVASCCVDICDRQKQNFKKECSVLFPRWGKGKISPNNKTINSPIKVGNSGHTMIHQVNKIMGRFSGCDWIQTWKNIICEQRIQNFKIYIFIDSFLALYLTSSDILCSNFTF